MRKVHHIVAARRRQRERMEMLQAMLLILPLVAFFVALGWSVAFPHGKVSEVMTAILSVGKVFL